MTETAATNAGPAESTGAAPISGGDAQISAPAAEKPISSMRDAYDAAQAELKAKRGGRPRNVEPTPKHEPSQKPTEASQKAETVLDGSTTTEAETQPSEPADKPLDAPKRWTDERKALFAKQPREIQEAMLSMGKEWETGFNKKFEELAGHRKLADGVREAFPPEVRAQMRDAGLDEVGSVKQLIAMQQSYMADPAKHIAGLIRHSGVDPRVFLQGQDAGHTNDDPFRQALAPVLNPLIAQIQELKQHHAIVLQERQDSLNKATEATILDFAGAKGGDGSLQYPHLERVADTMAEIIIADPRLRAMSDRRAQLETAYQMAVLGDPDLRAELVSAEAQKRISAMEQGRQSDRVLSAASVKPSKPSSHHPAQEVTDMRSAHKAALRQLGKR
jgi:hypothetical protein